MSHELVYGVYEDLAAALKHAEQLRIKYGAQFKIAKVSDRPFICKVIPENQNWAAGAAARTRSPRGSKTDSYSCFHDDFGRHRVGPGILCIVDTIKKLLRGDSLGDDGDYAGSFTSRGDMPDES